MKNDYNKMGGCVVNLDIADEYTTALNRRKRQIAITNIIKDYDSMKDEITLLRNELDELKKVVETLLTS